MEAVQKFINFLQVHNIENLSTSHDDIVAVISDNYNSLTQEILRAMVDSALKERDEKASEGGQGNDVLGSWGIIIDTVKEQMEMRRERAGENMQQLIAFGLQGEGKCAMRSFLENLRDKGHIDSVLIDLVKSSKEDINKYSGNNHIKDVIEDICSIIDQEWCAANSKKSNSCHSVGGKLSEEELIAAGEELRLIVQSCGGDAKKLQEEVANRMQPNSLSSTISLTGPAFNKVLDDNISACRDVGYSNKALFLEFLKKTITTAQSSNSNRLNQDGKATPQQSGHINHAPKFVDDSRSEVHVSLVEESNTYIDVTNATEALSISAKTSDKKGSAVNSKKKGVKSANKKKVADTAAAISEHLDKHGWAVCDHAIPLDLVKRVRVEAGLFTDFYENSEIWVGKNSDVGAQLSVPSVRGDRVLWMCGGHKAVEGVSRTVRTAGEVEPCRLEVKAQAPIRKFAAMRDLVSTIDCLVHEMKKKTNSLSGLFERSDAMLAMYPGDGSRFARHVDNTTADGRRLTVLAYLNPSWSPELGGALRIFTKGDVKKGGGSGEVTELKAIDVAPLAGRLAMFYSAEIQHEVRPTFGMRHSITLWYYDKEERQAAEETAKGSGSSLAANESSVESQRAAKDFISELMGGDDVQEDGGLPSKEDLRALLEKLNTLDDETVGIISSITGAPSAQSFREGFPLLNVEDLKQMRGLFRRMGLDQYSIAV